MAKADFDNNLGFDAHAPTTCTALHELIGAGLTDKANKAMETIEMRLRAQYRTTRSAGFLVSPKKKNAIFRQRFSRYEFSRS